MIFKLTNEEVKIDPQYEITALSFSFGEISQLLYLPNEDENEYLNLQEKIDKRIFPDLIASVYRKMYENSLAKRGTFKRALLACSYILQKEMNYAFLGFIRGDQEEVAQEKMTPDFVKDWNFETDYYNLVNNNDKNRSLDPIDIIFSRSNFEDGHNLFFIAGCQSFEMVDMRIKKAATVIAQLIKTDVIQLPSVDIYLSGWNNSRAKVQFANESLVMRNLLILKFIDQLGPLPDDFIRQQIDTDIFSKNSIENIAELIKKIKRITPTLKNQQVKRLNLFLTSSTFHLLQLAEAFAKRKHEVNDLLFESGIELDVYLVGSENPDHFFKIFDSSYIKYLMTEVIHRSFKFFSNKSLSNIVQR